MQRGGSEMGTGAERLRGCREQGEGSLRRALGRAAQGLPRTGRGGSEMGTAAERLRGCPALRARGTCHESSPQVCRRGTESPPEEKRRATSGDMPAFCLSPSGPPAAQTRL